MVQAIKLSINHDTAIARLVFDLPDEKVNKLSSEVLLELDKILDQLMEESKVKVLLIESNKKDIFIAGADINEIMSIKDQKDAYEKVLQGQMILAKIETLPMATVALIDGACLGGGLELALACKYRVAIDNPKTKLGLPEVNLGIIPGFGGTQRLPRLVGLQESLKMILTGSPIDTRKAYKIGLVDMVIRQEFRENLLDKFIKQIVKSPTINKTLANRNENKKRIFFRENLLLGKYLIYFLAKKNLMVKTKGNYPAPLEALSVIKKTYNNGDRAMGYKIEVAAFAKLASGTICKNLIKLFFLSEEVKKDSGVVNYLTPKEVKHAGVLGAGVMGGGIAWLFSNYNIPVRIKDISNQSIALGYEQILKIYGQLRKIKKYSDNQIGVKINYVSSGIDYHGFDNADIIVEAVVENLEIKKKVLSELEQYISKDAIVATNTSSLPLLQMSDNMKYPERFVGMHFFNPVNRMPLVEVIRSEKTSDYAVATIVNLSKKMGKTPIVVKDVPGFLVNRILLPYINEAGFLLQEGNDLQEIDHMIENFGMPMGPFTLADIVGIDVGYKVAKVLEEAYGSRMNVCQLLVEIARVKNLLGKKSSQGFFRYNKNGRKKGVNPMISSIVAGINDKKHHLSPNVIVNRCLFVMINEATRCLEENVVKNAGYLDLAMIMGTGFPAFRGGLLRYADTIGIDVLVAKLEDFSQKYGERFQPSNLLIDMAKNERKFYS